MLIVICVTVIVLMLAGCFYMGTKIGTAMLQLAQIYRRK